MTTAHLRDMLTIKLFSLSDGKPSQAEFIAVHNSLTLVGFCSWTIVLIWSQRFSIGLRSVDCAGQSMTVICPSLNYSLTSLEVWHVALSCWFTSMFHCWLDAILHNSSPAILLTYTLPSLLCKRNLNSALKITWDHCSAVQSLWDCANSTRAFLWL